MSQQRQTFGGSVGRFLKKRRCRLLALLCAAGAALFFVGAVQTVAGAAPGTLRDSATVYTSAAVYVAFGVALVTTGYALLFDYSA